MNLRKHPIKLAILEQVEFLGWLKVAEDDIKALMFGDDVSNAWISPDVNSLHLFWKDVDGEYWHEIADYDNQDGDFDDEEWLSNAVTNFLEWEIGHDAEGDVVFNDIFAVFNDYNHVKYSEDNPPKVLDLALADKRCKEYLEVALQISN